MQNTTSDTYNADIKECVTGGMWISMERRKENLGSLGRRELVLKGSNEMEYRKNRKRNQKHMSFSLAHNVF